MEKKKNYVYCEKAIPLVASARLLDPITSDVTTDVHVCVAFVLSDIERVPAFMTK